MTKKLKTVRVAAAVIREDERIFATARGYGEYKGGWEFPGGKIEPEETPEQALVREIKEELDVEICVDARITTVEYDYPTFHLSMDCFWCHIIGGKITLKEALAAKWLTKEELGSVDWLPADQAVVEMIQRGFASAFGYVEMERGKMIRTLRHFVRRASCSREPEVMPMATEWVCELLRTCGFEVTTHEVGGGNAPVIKGELAGTQGGSPVIFAGHYDTALDSEHTRPGSFEMKDDKLLGCGVLDMKGGIVIAIHAIRAARRAGASVPIRILLAGDEEINHRGSHTADVLRELAVGGRCAFNMETGLVSNQVALFRKGGTRCKITVRGVAAHAGNDFTKGRSAIVEMAHKIVDIHNLTDLSVGTTMNIGTIEGGTIFNAVPEKCEAVVDMRFEANEELEKGKQALEAVCRKTYIEGTTTEFEYIDEMSVFETTEESRKLYEFLAETARMAGLPELGETRLGGSSDAAYLAMAGVPTLCSCGAMGEWNHTTREYILKNSLCDRAKLFAAALLRMS